MEEVIVVIGIVMRDDKPFNVGLLGYVDGLLPAAVTPTAKPRKLLGSVLAVVNEQVGVARELNHVLIDALVVLDVGDIHEYLAFGIA
jgi:hypothetical protein